MTVPLLPPKLVTQEFMLPGFADSCPSESIQKHDLPGIAVSVLFPYKKDGILLDVPVKQYKHYEVRKKLNATIKLREWLSAQKIEKLFLGGFIVKDTQESAAKFGIDFLEELPNVYIKKHYSGYRLFFENESIDLAHAVALQYYFFAIQFGALQVGLKIPPEGRKLLIFMDRFPGADTNNTKSGIAIPPTQCFKFLKFMNSHSPTWKDILEENRKISMDVNFENLDWFKVGSSESRNGKLHPHFVLPDWLNRAALAEEHYDKFIETFSDKSVGIEITNALKELYYEFKTFEIWSPAIGTISHIKPQEKTWNLTEEEKGFIMNRAK